MLISEAQKEIKPTIAAQMIIDFWNEFRDVYSTDVTESMLCAVGPLQTMIGLAIKNGHLAVVEKKDND